MENVNLLKFINSVKSLRTLEFSECSSNLVNFLDILTAEDEQFTQYIDLGIIYIYTNNSDQCMIIDGVNRILSLSLLLHAICECYKKTSSQNDKAIKTIRNKYLIAGSHSKLRLPEPASEIYNKIINGEKLSGHEKATPMFSLLHRLWSQIKEEKLKASKIFEMLKKINVTIVEADNVSKRHLYYQLNKNREINQILLIEDYLKEYGCYSTWSDIKNRYFQRKSDIELFFKDFFINKFNYKQFQSTMLYERFVNYFETMMQYMPEDTIVNNIKKSVSLYSNMINVNFSNELIKQAFIKIKKNSGEDTYAYILDIYKDYTDNNISEEVFIEILNTIAQYLEKRKKSQNNTDFNELIQFLNAYITCK